MDFPYIGPLFGLVMIRPLYSWKFRSLSKAISGAVHGSQQRRKRCQGHSVVVPWLSQLGRFLHREVGKSVSFIGGYV